MTIEHEARVRVRQIQRNKERLAMVFCLMVLAGTISIVFIGLQGGF